MAERGTAATNRKRSRTPDASDAPDEPTTMADLPLRLRGVLQGAALLPATMSGWRLADGLHHLAADPKLADLIARHGIPEFYLKKHRLPGGFPAESAEPPFSQLSRIIVFQQLNGKVAETIWERFTSCFSSAGRYIHPEDVLGGVFSTEVDAAGRKKQLINGRESGLSASKSSYVRSLAEAFTKELRDVDWAAVGDEELAAKLTAVRGLGPWSVQIFLMTALHRPNVIPVGDLGIRRGLCLLRDLPAKTLDKAADQAVLDLFRPWHPYCSLASHYLWRRYEDKPRTRET